MVTEDDLRRGIRAHDEPFVTATDIANTLGVARQTAHKHLQRLHESGDLKKRKIGGSVVIWWLPDVVADDQD